MFETVCGKGTLGDIATIPKGIVRNQPSDDSSKGGVEVIIMKI